MNIIILDTDTELNKFYKNTFKKQYSKSKINFVYSANDLFNLLENEIGIHPQKIEENKIENPIPQEESCEEYMDTSYQNEINNDENVIVDFEENAEDNNLNIEPNNDDIIIDSKMNQPENNDIGIIESSEQQAPEQEAVPDQKKTLSISNKKSKVIVISESYIPDMDTFDFLEKMKLYNVPVVVVTSEHSERMIIECLRHGASDFLSKRNIKHGHFLDIIERALYTNGIDKCKNKDYNKLNKLVLSSLKNEKSEKIRNRLSRGMLIEDDMELIEGEDYNITYLYVQIKLSKKLKNSIDSNRLKVLYDKYLNRFSEISLKYGRKFGLRKMDGCFFGFANEGYFQALVAAMEILAQMNIYNVTTENLNGKIYSDIAIAAGNTKYKDKIGDITSESLNLCAHMAIKAKINHGILITKDIYKNIDQRAVKYFKKAGEFEGSKVYIYRTEKD